MRKQSWLLFGGLSACLALSLAAVVLAADDTTPSKITTKEPADPPGTTIYMAQFRLLFDTWDLNGDGYLNKAELAKAFRGPTAKPYDYKPAVKDKKDDKDPKEDKKDSTSSKDPTTAKKPNYSKYPDYNFLIQLDQDSDEMISRHEFLSWGRDVSVQLKAQADLQSATGYPAGQAGQGQGRFQDRTEAPGQAEQTQQPDPGGRQQAGQPGEGARQQDPPAAEGEQKTLTRQHPKGMTTTNALPAAVRRAFVVLRVGAAGYGPGHFFADVCLTLGEKPG